MKTKPTTLRSILTHYRALADIYYSDVTDGVKTVEEYHTILDRLHTEAEQAIKELIKSKLPEKKYVSEDEDPAKAYDDLVHQGYNQAIQEIIKIIEGL